jgi:hypothetical protein
MEVNQLIEELAQGWERLLNSIRGFMADSEDSDILEIKEELIELAEKYSFSGHDLAESLVWLLERRKIYGRFGKVILEFEYEWVKKAHEDGVRDLKNNLSYGKQ